jgi:hypothetical protein
MSFLTLLLEKANVNEMVKDMAIDNIGPRMLGLISKLENTESHMLKALQWNEEDKQEFISVDLPKIIETRLGIMKTVLRDCERILVREDRVIWAVRIIKLGTIYAIIKEAQMSSRYQGPAFFENPNEIINTFPFLKKLISKMGTDSFNLTVNIAWSSSNWLRGSFMANIGHFFSQPVPPVANFVFGYQSPEDLFQELTEIEDEYNKRFDSYIEYDEFDGEVLKWYDGKTKAWVRLDRASCSDEARAMGHCGNSPREHSGDNILSFRTLHETKDGGTFWEPHLTFILTKDNELTEMKGKGNDKPAEHYHPYIVDLLLMPIIDHIVGGGYKPENNFDLYDLTPEEREKVLTAKPDLIPPVMAWMEGHKDGPEKFKRYLINEYNPDGLYVNESYFGFDIGTRICDLDSDFRDYKDEFIKQIIKETNAPKDIVSTIFHGVEAIMLGVDVDDFIQELDSKNREIILGKALKYAFENGDVKIKKAIWKYSDISIKQLEFDFVSKSDRLVKNMAGVASRVLENTTKPLEKLIYNSLAHYAYDILTSMVYTYYYGGGDGSLFLNDLKNWQSVGIDEMPIMCEVSKDAFSNDEIAPSEVLDNLFGSNPYSSASLEPTGDKPDFVYGTDNWAADRTEKSNAFKTLTQLIAMFDVGNINIEDMTDDFKNTLPFDIYLSLVGERHPKDVR